MSLNSFGYDLELVASDYLKYRPMYPVEMYDRILKYLDEDSEGVPRRGVAVDVGCGSGQSTWLLARSFETVIGVDPSEAQLKEARIVTSNYNNITYRVGQAESLNAYFSAESVDLVTVGTALQWFDFEKFYKECLKILKVGGILAAYGCFLPVFDIAEATDIVHKLFTVHLRDYYPPRPLDHVLNRYRDLYAAMPDYFRQCSRDDSFNYRAEYNLEEVMGYFKTHPQYYFYKEDHPEEPDIFNDTIVRLQAIYDTKSMEDKVAKASYSIPLLMGRK